ncbi:M15 family metallopeptidase [Nocardioides albus]|uniref:Peptidase M15C domain-containing protein n=1 Tax=Nocardioides albus TaxID=1841 RepID=A0A7W5A637_9ACTN|nr:M15 family metallopeptidase [Nocardioides albus]MBB3090322.1 hypothetical protein [Nocardioides albus]GGU29306.1 hypothetical protein GCM10007979_30330 [Nocardioides albus]
MGMGGFAWVGTVLACVVTLLWSVPASAAVDGVLRLSGPGTVVDERSSTITITLRTPGGRAVPGSRVKLYTKTAGADGYALYTAVTTDAEGRARVSVRPRYDTIWRASSSAVVGVNAAWSNYYRLDNVPPVAPVRLPSAAPKPRRNPPAQPRATGSGANGVVTSIPDGVWRSMVGVSWHSGCPVGRASLRLLRINYWDYSGYRRRGEIIAHRDSVGRMKNALTAMYAGRYPIRRMYRVDRFGYSKTLRGGNDYASMDADNTSAFNCRNVVGRPGVRSPHSYGRSLDVNPWENPYRSRDGYVPNRWWPSRSHPRVAWRSTSHGVVRAMRNNGMRWTYGSGDLHHFDAPVSGRVAAREIMPCGADAVSCH